jgi:F-type H+-transporting ATPase subunit a
MAHEPDAFNHVLDDDQFELFTSLIGQPIAVPLPKIFGFQITKFMVLELFAAALILAIFIPLARKSARGALPKGAWWNAFESLLTFVRDKIARPNLGEHDADKYVPFLWTQFLFILFCNLLGMIPLLGSPTASIYVTAGLAAIAFVMLHGAAIAKMGGWHYLQSLWPHIDVPYVGPLFSGFIFAIELLGTFIKSGVLAVRLFANMFAGHLVLAMILLFIFQVGQLGNYWLWGTVTVASVFGQVGLSLLELFVAFLQAYVFTFLTALFMGMSLHPQH